MGSAAAIELVRVPAGSFQMGTDATDAISMYQLGVTDPVSNTSWSGASRPVHAVTFAQPFYVGKYAVTQAQWQAVMDDNPSMNTGDPNRPVDNVSWEDAVAFCQALSTRVGHTTRLPSEAEWEYACKAGSGDTKYSFGDEDVQMGQHAWYHDNSGLASHPVGQKRPNAFGLYDVHGNVWEWCQDNWHDNYGGARANGSVWSTGRNTALRDLRGGSFYNTAGACRSAYRNEFAPNSLYGDFGFRIVVP